MRRCDSIVSYRHNSWDNRGLIPAFDVQFYIAFDVNSLHDQSFLIKNTRALHN